MKQDLPLPINIANLNKRFALDLSALSCIARQILRYLGRRRYSLEVVFVGNDAIRRLNRSFTGRDTSTDVLSFDLRRTESGREPLCGCICISSDKALTNSRIFGTGFDRELVLYIIHGVLHLVGYDDTLKDDARRMHAREEKVLAYLSRRGVLSNVRSRSKAQVTV